MQKVEKYLKRFFREHWLLNCAVFIYILILVSVTLVRHSAFESSAWDLGIFNQALSSTLQGKTLYYTVELYGNPGGSIFGVHFSPILFLILPVYASFPTPETLLVVQTGILAVGAYPTFLLAKFILKSDKLGMYFSVLYLLNPHLYSINIFDFHPDAFFVPLALFSIYFFVKKRWIPYFSCMILSLLSKEFMAIMFLIFALVELLESRRQLIAFLSRKKYSKKIICLIITVLIAISWYLVSSRAIQSYNPQPPTGFKEGTPWEILGVNPLKILSLENTGDIRLIDSIKFDFQIKLFYLITLLAPLVFLPVFKISKFSPVIAWLLLAFLSNYPPYYTLGWHYSAGFLPFLIFSGIEGYKNLISTLKSNQEQTLRIAKKIFVVGILSALTLTFLLFPMNIELHKISEHDRKASNILNWINNDSPQALLLTQFDMFPHISNRLNSYVIPPPFAAFERNYYFEYVGTLFEKNPNYIIIDVNPDITTDSHYLTNNVAFKNIYVSEKFGLFTSIDGILVYKFNYKGDLISYEPFSITRTINNKIDRNTNILTQHLPPGLYNLKYTIKISNKNIEKAVTIEIRQNNTLLTVKNLYGAEFNNAESFQTFSIPFSINSPNKPIELWITNLSIQTELYMEGIEISIIEHSK